MKKQNTIEILDNICSDMAKQVRESLGSLFTKDDVVSILTTVFLSTEARINDAEDEDEVKKDIDIDAIIDLVSDAVGRGIDRLRKQDIVEIEYDSAEMEINYSNVVSVTDIDFEINTDTLADSISDELESLLNEQKNSNEE